MVYVYARQTVEDYESWKATLEDDSDSREELGSRGIETFRVYGDSDDVVVMMELEEESVAETAHADLGTAFEEVMDERPGEPEMLVLEKTDELSE